MKKSLLVTIIIVIVLVIASFFIIKYKERDYGYKNNTLTEEKDYCQIDSDCVPATCCHPSSCVISEKAPECARILCTQECKPGTLDCGQGKCLCINNECKAIVT